MNKVNQINELMQSASNIKANNEAVEAGKSAKNTFSWQAFFILKEGFIQDKQALERLIKKDNELHHCRSYVSKAKTVLNAIESGAEIATKDGQPVSIETLKGNDFSNLPEMTLSTLYSSIKKAEKEAEENDTILEHAFLIMEEQTGQTIEQIKQVMPESFDDMLETAKKQASEAINAAKTDYVAEIKSLVSSLSAEQVNEVASYIMDKVNTNTVSQVA